jgi:uncharacterized membrane protein (UPF0182 family)
MDRPSDFSPESPALKVAQRRIVWIFVIIITVLILLASAGQILNFWLNIQEFGSLYLRPVYFGIIGGFILSVLAFTRIDFRHRRSISWWALRVIARVIRGRGDVENLSLDVPEFRTFRLSPINFVLWQVTKVIILSAFLLNTNLGMAIIGLSRGWDAGLSQLPTIFALPFVTPPFEMIYAQQNVIPMIPALTLIVIPIFGAISIRLVLLVGITELLKGFSSILIRLGEDIKEIRIPVATLEALLALGLFWTGINLFFPSYIDFNTKFIIGGVFAAGVVFSIFAFLDRAGRPRILKPTIRLTYVRIGAILLIGLIVGSAVAVQGSIADARKVEWRGPYTAQEIAVNRYLAELDDVKELPYNFSILPLPEQRVASYVDENSGLLSKIRLWDLPAASAKLRPEIGLIPYVDFQDTDILRFNNTLYWSASLKPITPDTVEPGNLWFAEHLVYTHVPEGFLVLDGQDGRIAETTDFFSQRTIYYGEGGLFDEVWSAYPTERETSDELNGFVYNGGGGIDVPPPLSWIFEPNFLLARPSETIHVMRFKDVYDRMGTLFPYFIYTIDGERIDMYPVSDGENTYWLMPLVVALEARNVPWSDGNPFVRHVGYSMIDTFDGEITLFILGDDYFSDLFKILYSDFIAPEIPEWLAEQTRYPEEIFEYRVEQYNFYHQTDPGTFIEAREFFEIPPSLDTYFIIAKPPGFVENEFLGLLSLQLRGSAGQNLAGYMVIRNDYPNLGEMIFYEVSLTADTKLLGPTAVLEALERNPDFATLRTLLRDPRVGDNILYRVGEHDVYFIPVYTAGAGGVVTQLGTIAAIGATFTGEYFIGFGDSAEEAFTEYLLELSGVEGIAGREEDLVVSSPEEKEGKIIEIFEDNNILVLEPDEIPSLFRFRENTISYVGEAQFDSAKELIESFIVEWAVGSNLSRAYTWSAEDELNFGFVVEFDGVQELHYITIQIFR